MKYYIVPDENSVYRHRRNIGIFKEAINSRCAAELVIKGGSDDFGLYRGDETHIICADEKNNVVYLQTGRQPFTVIPGNPGIRPYDFTLTNINGFLDLFYKTDYENKTFLFHCILGSSEKPYVLAQLKKGHTSYCIGASKAYFTCDSGFGYADVAHGREKEFVKISDTGDNPCVLYACGAEHLTYTDGGKIYVDKSDVISDSLSEKPLLFFSGGKYILQWLSGGRVKYSVSSDCKCWSAPMRYISGEKGPYIIETSKKDGVYRCYGTLGSPYTPPRNDVEEELEEIKKQLIILKNEIKKLDGMNYFNDFGKK